MEPLHPVLKYLAALIVTFGVSHLLFSALEKAEQLPSWLTPIRAAMLLTFLVQVWLYLNSRSAPVDPIP